MSDFIVTPDQPWKMWGLSEVKTVVSGGFTRGTETGQLVRISYRRPETWRFLFFARILEANLSPIDVRMRVSFVVMPGVGRAVTQLVDRESLPAQMNDSFCDLTFFWTAGSNPNGRTKWATSVRSPLLDDEDATSFTAVDHVVAENLQVAPIVGLQPLGANLTTVTVEYGAFFAPNVHVRPDWFADADAPALFRGNEVGGT